MPRAVIQWFFVVTLAAGGACFGTACGSETSGTDASSADSTGASTASGQGGDGGSSASNGGSGGNGGNATSSGGSAEEVKVAFLGDSGNGSAFIANLNLIKSEGADFVFHEGDFDYGEQPLLFWATVDQVLGHDYPYLLAVGNHDDGAWIGYAEHMTEHMTSNGIVADDPDHSDEMWAATYKGLKLVAVGQRNNENPAKQAFIEAQLDAADPSWKICNWHKNQNAMQIGGKGNEMGWGVYEACRQKGALIVTGHEHSYSRTKTLTNMESQTVDATCSDPNQLCVGPGRTFAVVSGLGGVGVRDQERCFPTTPPYGCNGEWAMIYAEQQNAKYGTMFITFNAGGDPKKATGYFKTIDGDIIDSFEITKD